MQKYPEFFKRNNRADFIDKAIAGTLKTEDNVNNEIERKNKPTLEQFYKK
jgi:hypothetical protein